MTLHAIRKDRPGKKDGSATQAGRPVLICGVKARALDEIEFCMLERGDLIYWGVAPLRIIRVNDAPPFEIVATAEGASTVKVLTIEDCAKIERRC